MVGLAPKLVRLDPQLDKSGTFSDQISVHLAHRANLTQFEAKPTIPDVYVHPSIPVSLEGGE